MVDSLLMSPQAEFRRCVDAFLSRSSWETTWFEMNRLIEGRIAKKASEAVYVGGECTEGLVHV